MSALVDAVTKVARAETLEDASRLVEANRPFVLRGGDVMSPDQFVEKFGDASLRISMDASRLPRSVTSLTVRQYRSACERWSAEPAAGETNPLPYAFHDVTGQDEDDYDLSAPEGSADSDDDPFADFVLGAPLPAFFKKLSQTFACVGARVAFGPEGTFADVHAHGAALNQVLHGEKRWRIYHPYVSPALIEIASRLRLSNRFLFFERELLPITQTHSGDIAPMVLKKYGEWHEAGLCPPADPRDPVWQTPLLAELVAGISFAQLPGDTVYLPRGWAHAVENRSMTLCRIYELEKATDLTRRIDEGRRLDKANASISMHPGTRIAVSSSGAVTEVVSPIDPVALEIAAHVDGKRTAAQIAERCSDPEAALEMLEELHGTVFDRAQPKLAFRDHDWDELYRSGGYVKEWDLGSPSPAVVSFLSSGTLEAKSRVLDVGCGAGADAIYMAAQGLTAYGIDVSRKAIEIAQFEADRAGANVEFKCESVTRLSFADSTMAAVFDRGCLENLSAASWPEYFAQAHRVLKPRGWLVIASICAPTSNVLTPIDRAALARFEDNFEIHRFENDAASGKNKTLAILRSKKLGAGTHT